MRTDGRMNFRTLFPLKNLDFKTYKETWNAEIGIITIHYPKAYFILLYKRKYVEILYIFYTDRHVAAVEWMNNKCFIAQMNDSANTITSMESSTCTWIILDRAVIITMFYFLKTKIHVCSTQNFMTKYMLLKESVR